MPREVTVREAVPADVDAIQHVALETWHATYDDVVGPSAVEEEVAERYREDVVGAAVDSDDVRYLVADVDGVVGYASAGPSAQVDDEQTAQLYSIFVDPDHWDHGIGGRLLDEVIERLRAADFDALRMCVLEANALGRSFYESYGFPVIERDTRAIAGVAVDEVVYSGTL